MQKKNGKKTCVVVPVKHDEQCGRSGGQLDNTIVGKAIHEEKATAQSRVSYNFQLRLVIAIQGSEVEIRRRVVHRDVLSKGVGAIRIEDRVNHKGSECEGKRTKTIRVWWRLLKRISS